MRAVLTFHHLGDDPAPVAFPARAFEALLRSLDEAGLPIVDLDRLLDPGAGPGVALAFDDGWRSVLTEALPMLRTVRAPAHLFLCTGLVAAESEVRSPMPGYARLDWDGVERLRRDGVAVESHTHTHADLRGSGAARVLEDCARADELIERRTGRRPRYFAYPYGRCDAAARGVAASRYAAAFTTRLAPLSASDDRYRLPRIDAHYLRSDAARRRLGRPSSRAWLALRGALRTLGGRQ